MALVGLFHTSNTNNASLTTVFLWTRSIDFALECIKNFASNHPFQMYAWWWWWMEHLSMEMMKISKDTPAIQCKFMSLLTSLHYARRRIKIQFKLYYIYSDYSDITALSIRFITDIYISSQTKPVRPSIRHCWPAPRLPYLNLVIRSSAVSY